jgi:hypothetical protein
MNVRKKELAALAAERKNQKKHSLEIAKRTVQDAKDKNEQKKVKDEKDDAIFKDASDKLDQDRKVEEFASDLQN